MEKRKRRRRKKKKRVQVKKKEVEEEVEEGASPRTNERVSSTLRERTLLELRLTV